MLQSNVDIVSKSQSSYYARVHWPLSSPMPYILYIDNGVHTVSTMASGRQSTCTPHPRLGHRNPRCDSPYPPFDILETTKPLSLVPAMPYTNGLHSPASRYHCRTPTRLRLSTRPQHPRSTAFPSGRSPPTIHPLALLRTPKGRYPFPTALHSRSVGR